MNQRAAAGSWEDTLPPDVVTRRDREHRGLLYPGESVLARSWEPRWAEPLAGDCYFRTVLFDQPFSQAIPGPKDPRTAMCVPAPGGSRNLDRLLNELDTVRQAAYLTRHSSDAATVAKSLRERRSALEEQLTEERRSLLASGNIMVKSKSGPDPAWVFSSPRPHDWLDQLSGWLLADAYPDVPVDFRAAAAALARPLRGGDAGAFFAELLEQPGADTTLSYRLGRALDIRPGAAAVSTLIRERNTGAGSPASYAETHRFLAHDVGLTGPWANLFILIYLREERPELEIRLAERHGIKLADGRPLLSDRLTSDLVPSLAWLENLEHQATAIGPSFPPSFAGALQHLAALCPEVALHEEAEAQGLLARRIAGLHEAAARSLDFLRHLRQAECANDLEVVEKSQDSVPEQAISRIGQIKSGEWLVVYHEIRDTYSDLRQLEQDLEMAAQLDRLSRHSPEIFSAQEYLAGAEVPENAYPSLGVDRQALSATVSPGSLLKPLEREWGRGRSWEGVSRELSSFKASYAVCYQGHHQSFYNALPQFQSDLEGANLRLRALGLLNTLEELGPPVGEGLDREMPAGPSERTQCSRETGSLDLMESPVCPECRLTLSETLPTERLERLLPRIKGALSAKTRALSGQLVGKVMNDGVDSRMSDFLAIVQASELSGLANTLDEELLSFVRRVLD